MGGRTYLVEAEKIDNSTQLSQRNGHRAGPEAMRYKPSKEVLEGK